MPAKLNLSAEEMVERKREQSRVASKKRYDNNKKAIAETRKISRDVIKAKARAFDQGRVSEVTALEKDAESTTPKKIYQNQQGVKNDKEIVRKSFDLDGIFDEIERLYSAGKIKKEDTKKNYRSNVNQMSELHNCNKDFLKCLNDPDTLIKELYNSKNPHNDKKYAVNTLKMRFETILFVIDKIIDPTGQKRQFISDEAKEKYDYEYNILKIKSKQVQTVRNETELLMNWSDFLELVKTNFGESSKQFLMTLFYHTTPVRDDFQLQIVKTIEESRGDKRDETNPNNKKNFIIVPVQGNCTIIINAYKTDSKYSYNHGYGLSDYASKLTREYMKKKKLDYGKYLFGNSLQSHFVSDMGQRLESEMPKGVKNVLIGTMRRMSASEADLDTPEKMFAFSRKMLHNVHTQQGYLGKILKKQTTLKF